MINFFWTKHKIKDGVVFYYDNEEIKIMIFALSSRH